MDAADVAPHVALAVAKMQQAEQRLAAVQQLSLFKTDYLE